MSSADSFLSLHQLQPWKKSDGKQRDQAPLHEAYTAVDRIRIVSSQRHPREITGCLRLVLYDICLQKQKAHMIRNGSITSQSRPLIQFHRNSQQEEVLQENPVAQIEGSPRCLQPLRGKGTPEVDTICPHHLGPMDASCFKASRAYQDCAASLAADLAADLTHGSLQGGIRESTRQVSASTQCTSRLFSLADPFSYSIWPWVDKLVASSIDELVENVKRIQVSPLGVLADQKIQLVFPAALQLEQK